MNNEIRYDVMENGYREFFDLTKAEALEIIERHSKCFPDNEYCLVGHIEEHLL